jgi:hypothetical protein
VYIWIKHLNILKDNDILNSSLCCTIILLMLHVCFITSLLLFFSFYFFCFLGFSKATTKYIKFHFNVRILRTPFYTYICIKKWTMRSFWFSCSALFLNVQYGQFLVRPRPVAILTKLMELKNNFPWIVSEWSNNSYLSLTGLKYP